MSRQADPLVPASPARLQPVRLLGSFFSGKNRYLPPILITLILVAGNLSFGFLESFSRTVLAILVSMVFEIALALMTYRKFPHLASAYITGISVGILIRSPAFWPYALCSAIAITSKYAIRWRGRHLWNPSNLAICAMLLLVPAYVAALSIQWGNALLPLLIVWLLGAITVYRVKRLHITGTYVVCFIFFAFIRAQFTGDPFLSEVSPITGPMYQLFIFFMLTDPKTTVKPKWAQCLVAGLVALVEMFLRLGQSVNAPFYALAIVGPIANVIEISCAKKQHPQAVASPLQTA